jgi:CRP/FNR family transcriptional regulator
LKDLRTYVINLSEGAKVEGLRQCQIFSNLPPEETRELASYVTPIVFSKGTFIFKEGDPPAFFYVVYEGLVQVFKTSGAGKNVTFTIAARGETLTASALFLDTYFVSTQAMNDVTLLRIGRKEWLSFVSRRPAVAMGIITLMAHRLNREYERIVDIVGEEVELRLVHSLCILATKFGTTLSLTRQELANFAGTTTETTIRVLSKLKKRDVISGSASRGEIVISDLAKLQNYIL